MGVIEVKIRDGFFEARQGLVRRAVVGHPHQCKRFRTHEYPLDVFGMAGRRQRSPDPVIRKSDVRNVAGTALLEVTTDAIPRRRLVRSVRLFPAAHHLLGLPRRRMATLADLVEIIGTPFGHGSMGIVAGGAGHGAVLVAGALGQPLGVRGDAEAFGVVALLFKGKDRPVCRQRPPWPVRGHIIPLLEHRNAGQMALLADGKLEGTLEVRRVDNRGIRLAFGRSQVGQAPFDVLTAGPVATLARDALRHIGVVALGEQAVPRQPVMTRHAFVRDRPAEPLVDLLVARAEIPSCGVHIPRQGHLGNMTVDVHQIRPRRIARADDPLDRMDTLVDDLPRSIRPKLALKERIASHKRLVMQVASRIVDLYVGVETFGRRGRIKPRNRPAHARAVIGSIEVFVAIGACFVTDVQTGVVPCGRRRVDRVGFLRSTTRKQGEAYHDEQHTEVTQYPHLRTLFR